MRTAGSNRLPGRAAGNELRTRKKYVSDRGARFKQPSERCKLLTRWAFEYFDQTGTRDALEGLIRPHFRYSSLISIFECHVCAKGRSGPLTGPCSVGKEATREAQKPGIPRRSGLARSSPGAARASFMSIFAQDLDLGLRPGSVASRFWTVFPCHVRGTRIADIASDTPQI